MGDATAKLLRGLLEPLVLDSIGHEPKHGYALIQELEQAFGEPPNRNQLYPLLNRLEREGLLQADRSGGRGKTRYALTGKGLERLKEYRLRNPRFLERIGALWLAEVAAAAREPAPSPGPEPEPPRGPRLLERVAVEGSALLPAPARGHAAGTCSGEVALRRPAAGGAIAVEFRDLDPACASCAALLRELQGLRDRWFGGPTPS